MRGKAFQEILGSEEIPLQVRRGSAEQSNTSILFGDRDEFAIGMPVQIDLETLRTNSSGDDVVIYRFRPARAGDAA